MLLRNVPVNDRIKNYIIHPSREMWGAWLWFSPPAGQLLFIRVTQPIRLHKVTVQSVLSEISTLANEVRALLVDLIFN